MPVDVLTECSAVSCTKQYHKTKDLKKVQHESTHGAEEHAKVLLSEF
jgi:hypothetical protein